MGSGEWSDIIYRWANGINKELFKKYNYGIIAMNVAYAYEKNQTWKKFPQQLQHV